MLDPLEEELKSAESGEQAVPQQRPEAARAENKAQAPAAKAPASTATARKS